MTSRAPRPTVGPPRRADLVVTTQTRDIGLLEFHQIDAAVDAGRAAGRAVVAALVGERLEPSVSSPAGSSRARDR